MNLTIRFRFPANRDQLGGFELINADGDVLLRGRALGRSDNANAKRAGNPERDPLKRYGDIPRGHYSALVVEPGAAARTYGPYKRLLLIPKGGPALDAAKNGRQGLMVHGGPLNPKYYWWEGLRPTQGCIRVSDEDMAQLLGVIGANAGGEVFVDVDEVRGMAAS